MCSGCERVAGVCKWCKRYKAIAAVPATVMFEIVTTPDDVSEQTPAGYRPRLGGKYGK